MQGGRIQDGEGAPQTRRRMLGSPDSRCPPTLPPKRS